MAKRVKTLVTGAKATDQAPGKTPEAITKLAETRDRRLVSYDWTAVSTQLAKSRQFQIEVPPSNHPCIVVTIPDEWPYVKIAPLYDVHLGSLELDAKKFEKDVVWLAHEPYTVTFNGGDLWDNAIAESVASSFSNNRNPNEQFDLAGEVLKFLFPKIMFGLPGNHEDRTIRHADVDLARVRHENLGIPYSPDYMICTIKWRNNRIRLLAHHGTGAANTPGGQRNAGRKDTGWAHGFDLYWTGHLHQALVDPFPITYFDQTSDLPVRKTVYAIISPSYLTYFGGYAAKKRLAPGLCGMTVVTIQEDGRIDAEEHANGPRL